MDVFLGLDGGGTGTRAVLWSPHDGRRSQGESGPSNLLSVGEDLARTHLLAALSQAEANWTGTPPRITGVHAGIAGAGQPGVAEFWKALLALRLENHRARITVSHDLLTAWAGAFGGEEGIVIVAGTGSAGFRRTASGREHRCGGWGHRLDDAGSGYWLGLAGLRRALRGLDGREPPSALLNAACDFFRVSSGAELPRQLMLLESEKETLARFGQHVVELADTDAAARQLSEEAVNEWLILARTLAERESLGRPLPVTVVGGLARSQRLSTHFVHQLQPWAHLLQWQPPQGTPLDGALFLAAQPF